MIRLATIIIILLFQFSCTSLIKKDQYSIQYFVKNIYNDSDIVKSGSLLSEPFKLRDNNFPSIIILGKNNNYTIRQPSGIEQYLPKGLSLIKPEDFKDDINNLENERMIVIDSINFQTEKKVNYLGYLTIFQVFIDSTKTKVYIYYSTTDVKKEMYRSFIAENHLIDGKWKQIKLTISEQN
jgi:hypothetical protein